MQLLEPEHPADRTPPARAFVASFVVSLVLAPWLAESLFARLDASVRPEPLLPILPLPLVALTCAAALVGLGFACVDGRSRPLVRLRDGFVAGLVGTGPLFVVAMGAGAGASAADVLAHAAVLVSPIDLEAETVTAIVHLWRSMVIAAAPVAVVGPLLGALGGLASTTPRTLSRVGRYTLWCGVGPWSLVALIAEGVVGNLYGTVMRSVSDSGAAPATVDAALQVFHTLRALDLGLLVLSIAVVAHALVTTALSGVDRGPPPDLPSAVSTAPVYAIVFMWLKGPPVVFCGVIWPLEQVLVAVDDPSTSGWDGSAFWEMVRGITLSSAPWSAATLVLLLLGIAWGWKSRSDPVVPKAA